MERVRLNLTETGILRTLSNGPASLTSMMGETGGSFSWTFKCVDHLRNLGLVQVSKVGRTSVAAISSTVLGNRLLTYLREPGFPDPELLLKGQNLSILPLLHPSGSTSKEIVRSTLLSHRTVASYLKSLRNGGIVVYKKRTYSINQRHKTLIDFIRAFSEYTNIRKAGSLGVPYAMLWQGRGEFLISVNTAVDRPGFIKAADSVLDAHGIDIVHRSEYYLYSPTRRKVSKAEAFVQAIVIDPREPRIARALRKAVQADRRLIRGILSEAERYEAVDVIKEVLSIEQA